MNCTFPPIMQITNMAVFGSVIMIINITNTLKIILTRQKFGCTIQSSIKIIKIGFVSNI